jgi:hypothetical protein
MWAKAFKGFFQFHADDDFLSLDDTVSLKLCGFRLDFDSDKRGFSTDLDRALDGEIKAFCGVLCKYRALLIASMSLSS